jgi:ATP-dependent Clp protease adapter protein ClpS
VLLRGPGAEELAVVRALVELTPLSPGAARAIAAEADAQGRAVVLVAHRERAELYVERLAERGLPVGLEPAE